VVGDDAAGVARELRACHGAADGGAGGRAPEPGAKPYADVGDTVKKGQVLCIIEAMKLMNEINSDVDGEVVKVYVENGQPVQYGERLFAIRPF